MNENTAEVLDFEAERQKRSVLPVPTRTDVQRPEGPNWLENIPQGWGFLCREDWRRTGHKVFFASCLQKVDTLGNCTYLWDTASGRHFWVVTNDFSLNNEWLQSIPVVPADKEEAPTQETENGTSNRTDPTELVEDAPNNS